MSFCPMCGKENSTQSPFCLSCGANLMKSDSQPQPQPQQQQQYYQQPAQAQTYYQQPAAQPQYTRPVAPPAPKKPVNKKLIGIICGAVAAFIVLSIVLIVALVNGSKVSVDDYIVDEVTFNGMNGYASVDYSNLIDYNGLEIALKDYKPLDYENMTEEDLYEAFYDEIYNGYYYYSDISDYITVECLAENNGSLSNGDKVEFLITINTEAINNNSGYKKKVRSKTEITKEFEVSGLVDPVVIDVLAGVEAVDVVETARSNNNGITKDVTFEIQIKEEYAQGKIVGDYKIVLEFSYRTLNYFVYTAADNEYLFGGKIYDGYDDDSTFDINSETVTCKIDGTNKGFNYGIVCAPETAEITAKKRTNIIRSADDISAQAFETLRTKAVAAAQERIGEGLTLVKAYVGYASSGSRAGYNGVSFIFTDGENYWNVYYERLSVYPDGSVYGIDSLNPNANRYSRYSSVEDFKDGFEEGYIFYEKTV